MTGFNMSEWVARPPKEVFDFITASENAPKIVHSVTSMVKLTEGPPRVGTRVSRNPFNGRQGTASRVGDR